MEEGRLEREEMSPETGTLEREIFGDTSSDTEDEEQQRSIPMDAQTRRHASIKAKAKAKGDNKERIKEGPVSEKVLEARRDFEEALIKIKSSSGRRRAANFGEDSQPVDLDEIAEDLRRQMQEAVDQDNQSVLQEQPALAKHRLLPVVLSTLNKKHLHEVILENGVLVAVRQWLEPLPNHSLPADHIRKALLEAVRMLPIETTHLRESHLGKIVMFCARRPGETLEVQRLAKELVTRWSRPIIGNRLVPSSSEMGEVASSRGRSEMAPLLLQSQAFREKVGRIESDRDPSISHRKLAMRLQKKSRLSKKAA